MEKILTISIAAYNAEKYIRGAIESLLCEDILNDLEIFVIDDGGTDRTLEIAQEYEKKYPNVVHAVHKDNGGFGSTVNLGIKLATGKYFKLLDADDWYEKETLGLFVEFLKKRREDVIIMPYYRVYEKGRKLCFVCDGIEEINAIDGLYNQKEWLGNPALCYKTEILKNSDMILPENIPYTDTIYCVEPFLKVNSIKVFNVPLYCYRIGNEEQSVNFKNMVRNIEILKNIGIRLAKFAELNKNNMNYNYICDYIAKDVNVIMKIILKKDNSKQEFINFDREISEISADVYMRMIRMGKMGKLLRGLRLLNYKPYVIANKWCCKYD